jgi:hypothetical protein
VHEISPLSSCPLDPNVVALTNPTVAADVCCVERYRSPRN